MSKVALLGLGKYQKEPTPDRTVTADGYMVGGSIMAPPGKVGLKICELQNPEFQGPPYLGQDNPYNCINSLI